MPSVSSSFGIASRIDSHEDPDLDLTIRSDYVETEPLDSREIEAIEHVRHAPDVACRLVLSRGILGSSRQATP